MNATQIRIAAGARHELPDAVAAHGANRTTVALLDRNVAAAYPDLVPASWRRIDLPGGESCKTFATLEQVVRQLAAWELDRRTLLVAIGGGAVGDLAGLTASLYLRGVDVVQVPTTLLAMLDSSVGGKTAINIPEGKNLVGSFRPPLQMIADPEFARTLPADQLRSGLAEAIKMGMGFRTELFELLEDNVDAVLAGDAELLTEIVKQAVDAKMQCVAEDPHETTGARRCLNLGHTLAHALEAMSDYTMLHGHAVAHGLHYALDLAVELDEIRAEDAERSHRLVQAYGFAPEPPPSHEQLLPYFSRDKKMESGRLHFVLPTGIGRCAARALDPRTLRPA